MPQFISFRGTVLLSTFENDSLPYEVKTKRETKRFATAKEAMAFFIAESEREREVF